MRLLGKKLYVIICALSVAFLIYNEKFGGVVYNVSKRCNVFHSTNEHVKDDLAAAMVSGRHPPSIVV